MENKNYYARAAGMLRKVLRQPEPEVKTGEDNKPAEPAEPEAPADNK